MAEKECPPGDTPVSNVIQFPSNRLTVEELLAGLAVAISTGNITHLMYTTIDSGTTVHTAMTTMPAPTAVYMNQLQRMSIEELIREKDRGSQP